MSYVIICISFLTWLVYHGVLTPFRKVSSLLVFGLYGRIRMTVSLVMRNQILMLFLRKVSYTLFCGSRQSIYILVIVIMIGGHIRYYAWVFITNYYDFVTFDQWFPFCTPCAEYITVVINIHHFCLCKKKKNVIKFIVCEYPYSIKFVHTNLPKKDVSFFILFFIFLKHFNE